MLKSMVSGLRISLIAVLKMLQMKLKKKLKTSAMVSVIVSVMVSAKASLGVSTVFATDARRAAVLFRFFGMAFGVGGLRVDDDEELFPSSILNSRIVSLELRSFLPLSAKGCWVRG